ncbi:MAG: phage portal protein [Chloroflexota bacterium]
MVLWARAELGAAGSVARLRDAERLRRYRQLQDFYEGRHFDRPRNGRSNLVLNYARTIVDKGIAYLLGRGLSFDVPPRDEADPASRELAQRAEGLLYDIYWDNDLDAVDLQVAQNAGVLGDGVYKVFYDPIGERIRVVNVDPFCFFARWAADDPNDLRQVEVAYSLSPEDLAGGISSWMLGPGESALFEIPKGAGGLNGSGGTADPRASVEVVERWTATELSLTFGERVVRRGPNPYGFIPFVHVPNLQPANQSWGVSDLVDVIPINRELNERVSDQADVIRYHADPPIVFKGVTEHTDLAVGPGTVWDVPVDSDVKLLEWQGQPIAVGEHIERILRTLYEIAETPRTAFGDSGRVLSGVALEAELRPLIQKTLRRRVFWTRALRTRNRLMLRLAERYGVDGAQPGDFAPYRSRVIWPPMVPRDDAAEVRNNVALVSAGLRSYRGALDALGVESPEEELRRIVADRERLGEPAVAGAAPAPRPVMDASAAPNGRPLGFIRPRSGAGAGASSGMPAGAADIC